MTVIERGAEAEIRRKDGNIAKKRVEKAYRHEEIDQELREERTEQEARLLEKARQAGVPVPSVIEREGTTLVMEYVEGRQMKEVFAERDDLWPVIGKYIASLHDRDIIHGDLTTSNIIVRDGDPVFIDFGLGFFSQRVEDRATDLRLLEQVLESTHSGVHEEAFQAIAGAYTEHAEQGDAVLERLAEIRERGRYMD